MNIIDNIKSLIEGLFVVIFGIFCISAGLSIIYYYIYWERVPVDYFINHIIPKSLYILIFFGAVRLQYLVICCNKILSKYESELEAIKYANEILSEVLTDVKEKVKEIEKDNN